MSFNLAYSEKIEESIDVDLMDCRNVGNIILGYADGYSQDFLVRFFHFLNTFIESVVYLDKNKGEWYVVEPEIDEIVQELLDERRCSSLKKYFSPKTLEEKDLANKLIKAIGNYNDQDILNLKINKKLAVGINGFAHNYDPIRYKIISARTHKMQEEYLRDSSANGKFVFEKDKFVTYFPNGFTVKEYIGEYLNIRGTPYDRHYTRYKKVILPSQKSLEKIREILNKPHLEANDCILVDFDFVSC